MDIREATADDVPVLRSIAASSLGSTYTAFLDEETIEDAVEQWYGDGLADAIDDDHSLFLIAERDEPVGFSQSQLVGQQYGTGQIRWLHIHPEYRGGGTGPRLLVRTRERLLDSGADQIQGFVLEDNDAGNEFYDSHGFTQAGQREVEIGEETFSENVYVEGGIDNGEWSSIDELDLEEETIYVSYGEAARGSKSPFYVAYETDEHGEIYSWFCGHCDSIDNAMDTMGRIECNRCGNRRKATRWDASYL